MVDDRTDGGAEHAGAELRQQAEARLPQRPTAPDALPPEDVPRVLHELQVHQIELELQNEELRRAQHALDASRARYFNLYDLAPVGYVTLSEQGLILEANLTAAKLLGVTRSSLVSQPISRFILPDDQDIYYRHRRQLSATGGPQVCELRMLRTDGAPFWARVEATAAEAEEGRAAVWGTVLSDITAQKQAEAALRQAHDTLEQRVADRTAELSGALQKLSIQSEQLRSLASDLTLVELRERLLLAEQLHDGLQQLLVGARIQVEILGRGEDPGVRQACQEISRLLEDALADARSLTAELSPPIVRTGGLLACLHWLARWSEEKHRLTVHLQAPAAPLPPLPEDITVLLFRSVRELLFNAVKYAQVPEATVTLAWDASGLTLTVADAGVGFGPRSLRGEGGGGFGLVRIRSRLELLGGCMTIDSAPGQGTRVTLAVLLPTADHPAVTSAPPQPMASPETALAPEPGIARKIRILIVDDHQVVRRALAQLLHAEADLAVVGEAGTGSAAVAQARQLSPDVVLMDVNLPEMNGIEATRAIHAAFPAMRVIGLSMYERGDQQAAMRDAGAVAYVSKSAPAEELLAAIRGGR
ncbi:MAG TPA: response regulator [Candidatus Methylomirabilis sp.]|nr:response regulator [Candidatus Methylomirabilis sp.]